MEVDDAQVGRVRRREAAELVEGAVADANGDDREGDAARRRERLARRAHVDALPWRKQEERRTRRARGCVLSGEEGAVLDARARPPAAPEPRAPRKTCGGSAL